MTRFIRAGRRICFSGILNVYKKWEKNHPGSKRAVLGFVVAFHHSAALEALLASSYRNMAGLCVSFYLCISIWATHSVPNLFFGSNHFSHGVLTDGDTAVLFAAGAETCMRAARAYGIQYWSEGRGRLPAALENEGYFIKLLQKHKKMTAQQRIQCKVGATADTSYRWY